MNQFEPTVVDQIRVSDRQVENLQAKVTFVVGAETGMQKRQQSAAVEFYKLMSSQVGLMQVAVQHARLDGLAA